MRERADIAVAVLDVLMPGMNGPELGKRFLDMGLGAKVLFVSGFAPESDGEVDVVSVLQKPFAPEELHLARAHADRHGLSLKRARARRRRARGPTRCARPPRHSSGACR